MAMRVGMQLLDRGSSDHITDARSVSTGCRYHSARSTRSVCWPTKSWMVWYRDIWDHLSVSPTCLADGLCVLQSPIVWQYQLLNCLRSAAEHFPFPVLKRGTNYRKKITSATSLSTFQRRLKTFLFRKSFPDIIADRHFSGPCGNLDLFRPL